MPIHGFLNIDKAVGLTSHDVVARLRRMLGQKRIGHGGTLDPLASGVLPIALGEATKLVSYVVEGRKTYHATVRLGQTTATDDAEGSIVETLPVPPLDMATIREAVQPFIGAIQQVPPAYSAIQIGGQRAYDLARRGETVALAARTVEIDAIEVLAWNNPDLQLSITCGKGTYIRSIARDLGAVLGCGAHLVALRRTAVGRFTIDNAVTLEALDKERGRGREGEKEHLISLSPCLPVSLSGLLPPEIAVADWPRVDLDELAESRIRNGLPIDAAIAGDQARAHAPDGSLVALLRHDAGAWRPFRVFRWTES